MGFWSMLFESAVETELLERQGIYYKSKEIKKSREQESKKKVKVNNTGFNPKNYSTGIGVFKNTPKDSKLRKSWSDEARKMLNNSNTSDQQRNVMAKALMLLLSSRDVYTTSLMEDEEKKQLSKEEEKKSDKLLSEKEFLKQYIGTFDILDEKVIKKAKKEYEKYKENWEKTQKTIKTFGSTTAAVTQSLNNAAKQASNKALEALDYLSKYQFNPNNQEHKNQLDVIESLLNSMYNDLITKGHNEAEVRGFPILKDEIIAHNRYKSLDKQTEESFGSIGKFIPNSLFKTDVELNQAGESDSVYANMLSTLGDTYKEKKESYKLRDDYDEDTIRQNFLNVLSGGEKRTAYLENKMLFGGNDDWDYEGVRGFNLWGRKGFLDDWANDKKKVLDDALTYQAILDSEGELAAKQWILNKILHEASNGMGIHNRVANATLGIVQDVIGDTAETIGGIYGTLTLAPTEFISGLVNGKDFLDAATDAAAKSFDNEITRWGHDLMSTGNWVEQREAMEAFDGLGINYNDMIIDPEKADNFFDKYGGFGYAGWVAETLRQASHTMYSVYAGKGLGKGGSWLGKKLFGLATKGSLAALKKGGRLGMWLGLAAAGANEGINDGIDVEDNVRKNVDELLNDYYNKEAITNFLQKYNIDANNATELARFLDANKIGRVIDENGNPTEESAILQLQNVDGQISTVTDRSKQELLLLLSNSELGLKIIKAYKNDPEIAKEIQEKREAGENKAIQSGLATALIENWINGSIRNNLQTSRANMRAALKQMRNLKKSIHISKNGVVNIDEVALKDVIKQKAHDAFSEAKEEGLQSITSSTFTAVGENNIHDLIYSAYDPNSWFEFTNQLKSDFVAGMVAAGGALMDLETYEAAVAGAIGSMMGYLDYKKGKGIKGLTWSNSIFQNNDDVSEQNLQRREFQEALLNTIEQKGGIETLMSMMQALGAFQKYDKAIANNQTKIAGEIDLESLIIGASTLDYIRDTEYGLMLLLGLRTKATFLGRNFGSDLSIEELRKAKKEKAIEMLTSKDGNITEEQKIAIGAVREYLESNEGNNSKKKNVRTISEIASGPTEKEIQALIDITETAQRTLLFVDDISISNARNEDFLAGLGFAGKNAFNVLTVLVKDLEKRLAKMEKSLLDVIQTIQPGKHTASNVALNEDLKQHVARFGNKKNVVQENVENVKKEVDRTNKDLEQVKKDIKQKEKQILEFRKNKGSDEYQTLRAEIAALKRKQTGLKEYNRQQKEKLSDAKKVGEIQLSEDELFLSVREILSLPIDERAEMLDSKNHTRYTNKLNREIQKAKLLLRDNGLFETPTSIVTLNELVNKSRRELSDMLTNPSKYEELAVDAQTRFRNSVINFRYESDLKKPMDRSEVYAFIDRLNEDVQQGLITEKEKDDLITRGIIEELTRTTDGMTEDKSEGWTKYALIEGLEYNIMKNVNSSDLYYSKKDASALFKFLRELHLTLEEFNEMSNIDKANLLEDSNSIETLTPSETSKFINLAVLIQNKDKELRKSREKMSDVQADEGVIEDNFIDDTAREKADLLEETRNVKRTDILLHRTDKDGNKKIGSRINRLIEFLSSGNILAEDSPYKREGLALVSALEKIGMLDNSIKDIKDLYQTIERYANEDSGFSRSMWWEVRDAFEAKVRIHQALQTVTYGDTSIAETNRNSANSMLTETMKISSLRADVNKKPILDFLSKYDYRNVAKLLDLNMLLTGAPQSVYYIVDPKTTRNYRNRLGNNYKHEDSLPIFTCVVVGEDYEGPSFDVMVHGKKQKMAPIGVLNENTEEGKNTSGFRTTNEIRQLAVSQLGNIDGQNAYAITEDNSTQALVSMPFSYKNFVKTKSGNWSERKNLFTELKQGGENLAERVEYILKKLHVIKDANDNIKISFENDNFKGSLKETWIRPAFMTELKDFATNKTISELLLDNTERHIANPIIELLYDIFTSTERSETIGDIIGDLESLRRSSIANINNINEKLDAKLKNHFYPAGYLNEGGWKYNISVDTSDNGPIILLLVSDSGLHKIDLLNLTPLFSNINDTGGHTLEFSEEDVNKMLRNMIFDEKNNLRVRDNGSTFCTVQISKNLVADLRGEREDGYKDSTGKMTEEESKEKAKKTAKFLLGNIIRGGGMISTGSLDADVESIVLLKPNNFNPNFKLPTGETIFPELAAHIQGLKDMLGNPNITTSTEKPNLLYSRLGWIALKKYISKGGKFLNKWVSASKAKGIFGTEPFNSSSNKQSEQLKDVATTIGSNTDTVFRHHLWSTREWGFVADLVEKPTLKKIPLLNETGDEYFTDEELEKEFGFKASQVKALANHFEQFILSREALGWRFVTDVIRPKVKLNLNNEEGERFTLPLSGELDLYAIDLNGKGHIIDFKTVRISDEAQIKSLQSKDKSIRESTIKNKLGETLGGYETQLNLYANALRARGLDVESAEILAIPVFYPEPKGDEEDSLGTNFKKVEDKDTMYDIEKLQHEVNGEFVPFNGGLDLFEARMDENDEFLNTVYLTSFETPITKDLTFKAEDLLKIGVEEREILIKLDLNWRRLFERADLIAMEQKDEKDRKDSEIKIEREVPKVEPSLSGMALANVDASGVVSHDVVVDPDTEEDGIVVSEANNIYDVNSTRSMIDNARLEGESFVTFYDSEGEPRIFAIEKIEKYLEAKGELNWNDLTIDDICNDLSCFG